MYKKKSLKPKKQKTAFAKKETKGVSMVDMKSKLAKALQNQRSRA